MVTKVTNSIPKTNRDPAKDPKNGDVDATNDRIFQDGKWIEVAGIGGQVALMKMQQAQMAAGQLAVLKTQGDAAFFTLMVNGMNDAAKKAHNIQ